MSSEDDPLGAALRAMPIPALPHAFAGRTLALARANLVPQPVQVTAELLHHLPVHAMSAALLSADAVFAADACIKMGKIFGG